MTDYPGMYDKLQMEEYGYRKGIIKYTILADTIYFRCLIYVNFTLNVIAEQTKTVYMIFYNFTQFIGFLYILLVMGIRYYRDGPDSMVGTFEAVGNAIKFLQILQYLEVMHPMFGYTKGGAFMPFLQISGRNFVLFAMINAEERMQTKPVVFYLFLLWSSIELVR